MATQDGGIVSAGLQIKREYFAAIVQILLLYVCVCVWERERTVTAVRRIIYAFVYRL